MGEQYFFFLIWVGGWVGAVGGNGWVLGRWVGGCLGGCVS